MAPDIENFRFSGLRAPWVAGGAAACLGLWQGASGLLGYPTSRADGLYGDRRVRPQGQRLARAPLQRSSPDAMLSCHLRSLKFMAKARPGAGPCRSSRSAWLGLAWPGGPSKLLRELSVCKRRTPHPAWELWGPNEWCGAWMVGAQQIGTSSYLLTLAGRCPGSWGGGVSGWPGSSLPRVLLSLHFPDGLAPSGLGGG